MAEFKRRTFLLGTGKQIKLFGNSIAMGNLWRLGKVMRRTYSRVPQINHWKNLPLQYIIRIN